MMDDCCNHNIIMSKTKCRILEGLAFHCMRAYCDAGVAMSHTHTHSHIHTHTTYCTHTHTHTLHNAHRLAIYIHTQLHTDSTTYTCIPHTYMYTAQQHIMCVCLCYIQCCVYECLSQSPSTELLGLWLRRSHFLPKHRMMEIINLNILSA